MGVGPFRSTSSCNCAWPRTPLRPAANPDPTRFTIIAVEQFGVFCICTVEYPDCTNYEGRKVLVFYDVTEEQLRAQKTLDPHFCDNQHLSPVARFEPTERGLALARLLVGDS